MKKKVLLLIAMLLVSVSARAAVTVEETTDAEYIINSGYSQVVAEDVFVMKNRALGKPIEPLYEKSQNIFVNVWKQFKGYIDPGQEEFDRLHHDVKLSPSISDL